MEASGYPCPECGSDKTQDVFAFVVLERFVTGMRLHCRSCEHVWDQSTAREAK